MKLAKLLTALGVVSTTTVVMLLGSSNPSNALQTHSGRSTYLTEDGIAIVRLPVRGSEAQDIDAFLKANRNVRLKNSCKTKLDITDMRRGPISNGRVSIEVRWNAQFGIPDAGAGTCYPVAQKSDSLTFQCSVQSGARERRLHCPIPAKVRQHTSPGYQPLK